jgi:AcrR family transcriptional regulator
MAPGHPAPLLVCLQYAGRAGPQSWQVERPARRRHPPGRTRRVRQRRYSRSSSGWCSQVVNPVLPPSARRSELLESAYSYALQHGLADMSLRPLAAATGSSPRVLLYLFGSKDGLVRAVLARARVDELALLNELRPEEGRSGLDAMAARVWEWLAAPSHRSLLTLWAEGYVRSLVDADGRGPGSLAPPSTTGWACLRRPNPRTSAPRRPDRPSAPSCSPSCVEHCSTCWRPVKSTGPAPRYTPSSPPWT